VKLQIEKYSKNPPLLFEELMEKLDLEDVLVQKVTELLKRKRAGLELGS